MSFMLPFRLTKKNQKGQVAIFVALIFQIIFIFFAILINVGLLVHHKINLQQSTDLAAYYGAMKQAEILNVIGHVNFQIRQAWKLLAWRYRVLGTFGMEPSNGAGESIAFPIFRRPGPPPNSNLISYNRLSETQKCTSGLANGLNITDVPFMCTGHIGFGDWDAAPDGTETFCKINCGHLGDASTSIPSISSVGNFSWGSANSGGSINTAIRNTNTNLANICNKLGPFTLSMLGRFYNSYLSDTRNRMNIMKILATNLSAGEKEMLDLEGKKVFDGVSNTFKNNLTEANLSSLQPNAVNFYNSVNSANSNECSYQYDGGPNTESGKSNLFAEVNFQFLQYFLTKCTGPGGLIATETGSKIVQLGTIYASSGGQGLDPVLKRQTNDFAGGNLGDQLENLFAQNNYNHTLGFEKNPWCGVYYGVRAFTEPKIPFLPLAKVRINAISIAKPFGGSIGPRHFKDWKANELGSARASGNETDKVDQALPLRKYSSDPTVNTLIGAKKIILNYSNYVGDNQGLADAKIIGFYHAQLRYKSVNPNAGIDISSSSQKTAEPNRGIYTKPQVWPKAGEWASIDKDVGDSEYDPVIYEGALSNAKNSYMRDMELSVVAPNQFDLSYYPIESDFYNVYLKNKLKPDVLDKLKNQAGIGSMTLDLPYDYGYSKRRLAGVPADFSVKNQLEIVEKIFKNSTIPGTISPQAVDDLNAVQDRYFSYIPKFVASLLTGWTFVNLTDRQGYEKFPDGSSGSNMPFGKCIGPESAANLNYESIAKNEERPPTPGNCVTGGRTGYSVKIVSPDSINGMQGEIGGPGTSGTILNPIPSRFLDFQ